MISTQASDNFNNAYKLSNALKISKTNIDNIVEAFDSTSDVAYTQIQNLSDGLNLTFNQTMYLAQRDPWGDMKTDRLAIQQMKDDADDANKKFSLAIYLGCFGMMLGL